jgi:CheY-like chemotaxis protein
MKDRDKARILLVDDDREFLEDMAILLSPYFEVIAAADSATALEIAVTEQPDCILVDLKMPALLGNNDDQEGYALLAQLRLVASQRGIPVVPAIVISAALDRPSADRHRFLGIIAHFLKPPEIACLCRRIEKAVQGRRQSE